jgi:hypothetical protein
MTIFEARGSGRSFNRRGLRKKCLGSSIGKLFQWFIHEKRFSRDIKTTHARTGGDYSEFPGDSALGWFCGSLAISVRSFSSSPNVIPLHEDVVSLQPSSGDPFCQIHSNRSREGVKD